MAQTLMLLPSKDVGRIRLVTVPEDMSPHEAYRNATSLIADVERGKGTSWVMEMTDVLEDNGFENVEFLLGPPLD